MKYVSIIFVATLVLSGCGKEKENQAALAQKLNGKIDGQTWTHTFGAARQRTNIGGTKSWAITLHDGSDGGNPCTATYAVGKPLYLVSFSLKDLSVGAYDVSAGSGTPVMLTHAVDTPSGFTSSSQGSFGTAWITKADDASVEGQLDVKGNEANYVKGSFTAKICR